MCGVSCVENVVTVGLWGVAMMVNCGVTKICMENKAKKVEARQGEYRQVKLVLCSGKAPLVYILFLMPLTMEQIFHRSHLHFF